MVAYCGTAIVKYGPYDKHVESENKTENTAEEHDIILMCRDAGRGFQHPPLLFFSLGGAPKT